MLCGGEHVQVRGASARSWLLSADRQGPGRIVSRPLQEQQPQPTQPVRHAEQQLPQSPAEPGPATSSATERIGQLLGQAAQEAGRAVLERAQLQQQLDEATARAEQGALQVATLRKQLAVRDAQLQRLSDRQQQEAANARSSSSGAEQVTPQQRSQLLVLEGDDAACRSATLSVHLITRQQSCIRCQWELAGAEWSASLHSHARGLSVPAIVAK